MGVFVQVVLGHRSGLPRDAVVNTFHFNTASAPTTTDLDNIFAALDDFYNDTQTAGQAVGNYIGNGISRTSGDSVVKYYDSTGHLDGSDMGSPIRIDNFAIVGMGGGSDPSLPEEVAICLSTHADLTGLAEEGAGGTRPKARRRGRLYIGPLASFVREEVAPGHEVRATTTAMNTMLQAGSALIANANTIWSIWSRTNADAHPVTGVFVDNAFDTVRSRGPRTTARVSA